MTVSSDQEQEEMKSNRHEQQSDEKHVTITDSPPSTLSLSPQSSRSYKTPSPAGDFGTYSWADDLEPRPKAHPNRSFPAEPLVVLTKSLDHPEEPRKNDVVFDHHSVESHEADYDDDADDEEEEQNDDVGAEKERSLGDGDGGGKSGGGLGSFNRRKLRPDLTRKAATNTTRKSSSSTSSHGVAKGALLGLRVCGFGFSLISFAVMASNRNQGWALDSFYRYKEFRYCFGVNLLGFIYSGFQVFDLIHFVTTHKHLVQHRFRYYFDFFIDQAISYLLMSASSSASTRVDDWQSNWGKDKFPDMARVSVGFSFAAFAALALSSIISGHMLCTAKAL